MSSPEQGWLIRRMAGSRFSAISINDRHKNLRPLRNIKKRWPLPILALKSIAKEGDRGAGDIIARTIGPIGGDAFKRWYKATFGKDCGCGRRQELLNAWWPL